MTLRPALVIVLLCLSPAWAADPEAYPMMATLDLPKGPVALALPPSVVAGDASKLSETLHLQDAAGVAVPFTVLTTRASGSPEDVPVSWEPVLVTSGRAWLIAENDVPLDGLSLTMQSMDIGPWTATVYLQGATGSWEQVGEEQFLYSFHRANGEVSLRQEIDLPHRRGPFKLVLEGEREPRILDIDALAFPAEHVRPVNEEVTVEGPVFTEMGLARYTIELPGPRAVSGLRLHIDEEIFSRSFTVSAGEPDETGRTYLIERARVGQVRIDETGITGLELVTDRLIIDVLAGREEPLTITGATVESIGAVLLAPDSGLPPQTLYFAGTEPDVAYDVAIAADELARIAKRVEASAVVPAINPGYVPKPTRDGLDGPAAEINLALWKWERPIVSEPGWTRVVLDAGVLVHARGDLGDLRVVDSKGRSLPFELRAAPREVEITLGELKREEDGATSELTLSLPPDLGAVRRIELGTDAEVFSRAVQIVRDRGTFTETIRSVEWVGSGSPHRLVFELNEELGEALMVRIQNGDDPPLSVTSVKAWTRGSELRVRVPEGGARLVYGNRRAQAPSFDLALLGDALGRVATHEGTLGPEIAGTRVTMTWFDQGLVFLSFAGLAVGLVALMIGAIRGADPVAPAPNDQK